VTAADFGVVSGPVVDHILAGRLPAAVEAVREAYLAHDRNETSNPHSVFLRTTPESRNRIIGLPAYLGPVDTAGIKWISSVPGNIQRGTPRASAVVILNDSATGQPLVCIEGSMISAVRTAASAALCLESLVGSRQTDRLGVVGTGAIAHMVLRVLAALGWRIRGLDLHDLDDGRARAFARRASALLPDCVVEVTADVEAVTRRSSSLLVTTTASAPHLTDPGWFRAGSTVLHLSLRDLGVDVLCASRNIVDDREHVLRERTSLHLATMQRPDDLTIDGTIADLLLNRLEPRPDVPTVVSPFGLGILDIAVARLVFDLATAENSVVTVPDFFATAMDSDLADGDLADGDLADGDMVDSDLADGGIADGDMADGDMADGDR
jgi:ornithine cyclodeaminase